METTTSPQLTSLGFGMEGLAAGISRVVLKVCEHFEDVTYLEIGIGYGWTLAPISELIRSAVFPFQWRSIGVDLPNGYSLSLHAVGDAMNLRQLPFANAINGSEPVWNQVTIYSADSQTFLRDHLNQDIQLALIDGCHGKSCTMNDFLNIEDNIPTGGIVMFHDFDKGQVGKPQPHCPIIDVRGACRDLGLLDNTRPGWKFLEELIPGPGGAGMGIFQKQ